MVLHGQSSPTPLQARIESSNPRPRSLVPQLYNAGAWTAGGMFGGSYVRHPESRILIAGLDLDFGYFPVNRLYVSAGLGAANDFRKPEPGANMQSFPCRRSILVLTSEM